MPAWPAPFTVRGRLQTAAGNSFHTNNESSDAHFRVSDDGSKYEAMVVSNRPVEGGSAPSPAAVTYSERAVAGDPLSGWLNNLDVENEPVMAIPVIPGTDNDGGVDSPHVQPDPANGRYVCAFQARPGDRPATTELVVHKGSASIIKAAVATNPVGASRVWTQDPARTLLRATESWQTPFPRISGSTWTWYGGVLEPTLLWLPRLQKWALFHLGVSEKNPGGPDTHAVGRALADDPLDLFVTNPTTPVVLPRSGDVWGNADIGMQQHVTLDPDGVTLWMVLTSAQIGVEDSHGIGLLRSDDDGVTWEWDPRGPLLTVVSPGMPPMVQGTELLGSPQIMPSADGSQWLIWFTWKGNNGEPGGANGGIYLAVAPRYAIKEMAAQHADPVELQAQHAEPLEIAGLLQEPVELAGQHAEVVEMDAQHAEVVELQGEVGR